MLDRLHDLARRRATFAFETTLAGRAYVSWITELTRSGYDFHLLFLWLRSPELAIRRVGRSSTSRRPPVPEELVRRRYHRGLRNFFRLYRPLATTWRLYDNSESFTPRPIAAGVQEMDLEIAAPSTWEAITGDSSHES